VRFGLLSPDSAAGVFFLLFGVFTFALFCYQHPCQVFSSGTNTAMVIAFVFEPESFMQSIISSIAKIAASREAKFKPHYYAVWLQI
jgi:hypothetical protein